MAEVSVILPVFQVEAVLPRSLDSLLDQTLMDLEVVVVNDGSPDGSQGIIDAYAKRDSRVRPVKLETNEGTFAARNAGIRAATAPFIGFIDADDRARPEMFARMLGAARETTADIVIGNVTRVLADGSTRPARPRFRRETVTRDIFERFVNLGFGGSLCNRLFRRELIADLPITRRSERLTHNEDYLLNLACFEVARRVRLLSDTLLDVFESSDSITGRDGPAEAFVFVIEAWSRAHEIFSAAPEETKRGIDTLYAAQLRFESYRVPDPKDAEPHRERLSRAIADLVARRPGFISDLVRYRPPAPRESRLRRLLSRFTSR